MFLLSGSKMEKGKLLTTRLLDTHGKIGPFFFTEFMVVFLGCASLYFLVLFVSLFIPLKGFLLIVVPVGCLLLVSLVRLICTRKIDSPWHVHRWVLYRFLQPGSIIADQLGSPVDKLCFPVRLAVEKTREQIENYYCCSNLLSARDRI
jgi:hypothetical protein